MQYKIIDMDVCVVDKNGEIVQVLRECVTEREAQQMMRKLKGKETTKKRKQRRIEKYM